jgi:hypothetical protein
MSNNKKNIFVWLLMTTIVFLLIYINFSISHDTRGSVNFIVQNECVNFSNIPNAPKTSRTQSYSDPDLGLPAYIPPQNTYIPPQNTYTVNSSSVNNKDNFQTNYDVSAQKGNLTSSTKNNNSGGAGVNYAFIGSRNRSTQTVTNQQTVGFTTLSTDLAANQGIATTPEFASPNPPSPTSQPTEPGGDPQGNSIPVGDGWGFLLFCSIAYVIIKNKFYSH